jgi:(E)-4-hydroxy-3-methylbut-2-enyl-diphosphate synthase
MNTASPALRDRLPFCDSLFSYKRRKTRVVMVGNVAVGGDNPLRLQSMTTTRTQDTDATVEQAIRIIRAGGEIVRITAPTEVDARNLKNIKASLVAKGYRHPLVADIHFRPEAAMEAAEHVEKVRINPGNFADFKAFKILEYTDKDYAEELERIEERFTPLVMKMKRLGRALRVGTNHGSLSDRIMNRFGDTPEGMVESALEFVRICRKNDFHDIILSMKASNPKVMIAAYRLLAARMAEENMDYPFHLGVTEAGDGEDGRIKSAVGIGSLLEDGIGDTLRVSLTEDPELEVPVAKRLADRFNGRKPTSYLRGAAEPCGECFHTPNFYHYARRESREISVGPIRLGGEQPPRVINNASRLGLAPETLLSVMEVQLKSSKNVPPEILEWDVRTPGDAEALKSFRRKIQFETSRLGYLARLEEPGLLAEAVSTADGIILPLSGKTDPVEAARAARAAGKPLFLEAPDADALLEAARAAQAAGGDIALSLMGNDASNLLHQWRHAASQAWVKEGRFPLWIQSPSQPEPEETLLQSATLAGALLCDGLGDAVRIGRGGDLAEDLRLAYNVLQGAGSRITKTEFVSCPSCGRTLFDLQTTTERIKRQTGHLVGVKIAIMGCIVNGPGEMADADFGYVGGGLDKINLYVGKDCVEKGIPTERADGRLIELIKIHGKWTEPAL